MAKLFLDTCAWLDITKPRLGEILIELEKQVDEGITVLLTCDIVFEEWARNKDRVSKENISSIRSHAKSASIIADFLPERDKSELERLIEKYTKAQPEKHAEELLNRVEKIMKKSESFEISDNIKIEMANRALTKKAPFHNSKNNMADALLYFGAVDYVNKENQIATDLIFVTSNYKEFSDPSDNSKIHPDLYKDNVHFSNNLARALEMRREVIDLMDEYHEYQLWDWIEWQGEVLRAK